MKRISRLSAAAVLLLLLLGVGGAAVAHEHRAVDGLETTVGWLEEPAYAGFLNAVQLVLERPTGPTGAASEEDSAAPVEGASLEVEVIFGGPDATEKTEPMELRPAFEAPGEYRAALIPTRPGTYTFHIFGTVGDQEFDENYTSGEDTFNDIQQSSEVEFPVQDPDRGQLAERLESLSDQSASDVRTATYLAVGAIVLALLAALLALVRGRRT